MRWMVVAAVAVLSTMPAGAQVDFGDHASSTLTGKAWTSLGQGDLYAAIAYVEKCISMYEGDAKVMQASLTAFPPNNPPDATHKFWALNDVGTCLFIKGEILMKQGDKAGAKAAYQRLVGEFGYAQCWDTKGWFWKPAEAAKQKLVELDYDTP